MERRGDALAWAAASHAVLQRYPTPSAAKAATVIPSVPATKARRAATPTVVRDSVDFPLVAQWLRDVRGRHATPAPARSRTPLKAHGSLDATVTKDATHTPTGTHDHSAAAPPSRRRARLVSRSAATDPLPDLHCPSDAAHQAAVRLLEGRLAAAVSENEALVDECAQWRRAAEAHQGSVGRVEADLETALATLAQVRGDTVRRCNRLQDQIDAERRRADAATADVGQWQQEAVRLGRLVAAAQDDARGLRSSSDAAAAAASKRIAAAETDVAGARAAAAAAEAQARDLGAAVATLHAQLRALASEHDDALEAARAAVADCAATERQRDQHSAGAALFCRVVTARAAAMAAACLQRSVELSALLCGCTAVVAHDTVVAARQRPLQHDASVQCAPSMSDAATACAAELRDAAASASPPVQGATTQTAVLHTSSACGTEDLTAPEDSEDSAALHRTIANLRASLAARDTEAAQLEQEAWSKIEEKRTAAAEAVSRRDAVEAELQRTAPVLQRLLRGMLDARAASDEHRATVAALQKEHRDLGRRWAQQEEALRQELRVSRDAAAEACAATEQRCLEARSALQNEVARRRALEESTATAHDAAEKLRQQLRAVVAATVQSL